MKKKPQCVRARTDYQKGATKSQRYIIYNKQVYGSPRLPKLLTPFKRGVVVKWRSLDCNESVSGDGHIKIYGCGSSRHWLISIPATITPRGQKNTPARDVGGGGRQLKSAKRISEDLLEFNPSLSSVPTQKCNCFNTSHKRTAYSLMSLWNQ